MKNLKSLLLLISLAGISFTTHAGQGNSSLTGFSGSGLFIVDGSGDINSSAQAPVPGYFELDAANELSSWQSHNVIRVACIQDAGGDEYFISGYRVANSSITFVDRPTLDKKGAVSSKTFSMNNVSTAGDKIVGRFKKNLDGTISRSNWTTGIENCIGVGYPEFGNNSTNPRSMKAYESCSTDRSKWVDIPDCDNLSQPQQDVLTLHRTTRLIDNLHYSPF